MSNLETRLSKEAIRQLVVKECLVNGQLRYKGADLTWREIAKTGRDQESLFWLCMLQAQPRLTYLFLNILKDGQTYPPDSLVATNYELLVGLIVKQYTKSRKKD